MDPDGLVRVGLAIGTTAAGAALLRWLWQCWTGRRRGWAVDGMIEPVVRGLGLPVAFLLLGAGLGALLPDPVGPAVTVPLLAAGLALVGPGLFLGFLPRRWWGPQWYRKLSEPERQRLADDRVRALDRLAGRLRSWFGGRGGRLAQPVDRHRQFTYEAFDSVPPPPGSPDGQPATPPDGDYSTVIRVGGDPGTGPAMGGAVGARTGAVLGGGRGEQLRYVAAYVVNYAWGGTGHRGGGRATDEIRPGAGRPGRKEGSR